MNTMQVIKWHLGVYCCGVTACHGSACRWSCISYVKQEIPRASRVTRGKCWHYKVVLANTFDKRWKHAWSWKRFRSLSEALSWSEKSVKSSGFLSMSCGFMLGLCLLELWLLVSIAASDIPRFILPDATLKATMVSNLITIYNISDNHRSWLALSFVSQK